VIPPHSSVFSVEPVLTQFGVFSPCFRVVPTLICRALNRGTFPLSAPDLFRPPLNNSCLTLGPSRKQALKSFFRFLELGKNVHYICFVTKIPPDYISSSYPSLTSLSCSTFFSLTPTFLLPPAAQHPHQRRCIFQRLFLPHDTLSRFLPPCTFGAVKERYRLFLCVDPLSHSPP